LSRVSISALQVTGPADTSLGNGIGDYDQFRDFANFLDGVGLPVEWSPYFQAPDPADDIVNPQLQECRANRATPIPRNGRSGSPFSTWLPSAPHGSRIEEVTSDHSKNNGLYSSKMVDSFSWRLLPTRTQYVPSGQEPELSNSQPSNIHEWSGLHYSLKSVLTLLIAKEFHSGSLHSAG
jgi:hypothetical protein